MAATAGCRVGVPNVLRCLPALACASCAILSSQQQPAFRTSVHVVEVSVVAAGAGELAPGPWPDASLQIAGPSPVGGGRDCENSPRVRC